MSDSPLRTGFATGRALVRARYDRAPEIAAYSETRDEEGLNHAERDLLGRFVPAGARVLDIGAGAGREGFGAAGLGYRVTALDLVPAMVRAGHHAARQRDLAMSWLVADTTALPIASDRFDAALLLCQLLEHFHRRSVRIAVLREAARCVRSGGHLIVSVHNGLWRPGLRHWAWRYANRRSAGELPTAADRGLRGLVRSQTWLRAADLRDAGHLAKQRLRFELRRFSEPRLELGDGWTDTVSHAGPAPQPMPFHPYNPGELETEVRAAGLRLAAVLPYPAPPPGRIGAWASQGAGYRYAAIEVP